MFCLGHVSRRIGQIRTRKSLEQDPASAQWFGGVIIQSEDNTIVGCAGFLGPPNDDGFVKIGFGVVPEYQGNGFATEIAQSLSSER